MEQMIYRALIVMSLAIMADPVSALCIQNRTQNTVSFVRGEPFAGMETYFEGEVEPGRQVCAPITARIDGTYPVSIYTRSKSGRCVIIRGCFSDNTAEQIYYRGSASSNCPVAFRDNTCN